MENNKKHLETLTEIKGLMQRSSKFVSLSGMSGIAAGTVAIAGAIFISIYYNAGFFEQLPGIMTKPRETLQLNISFLLLSACIIFIAALVLASFFSSRNAKTKNLVFWDSMAKRVLINLLIFIITGGIFCMILLYYGIYFLIVPAMLTFYGLALINVSKFTFNEIAQLGVIEICLGIAASFVTVYPLLIWTVGFGVLHLIYGIFVYLKYERA